jgi:hypothetical protein
VVKTCGTAGRSSDALSVATSSLTSSDPPAAAACPQHLTAGGFDGVSDDAYNAIAAVLIEAAERLAETAQGAA